MQPFFSEKCHFSAPRRNARGGIAKWNVAPLTHPRWAFFDTTQTKRAELAGAPPLGGQPPAVTFHTVGCSHSTGGRYERPWLAVARVNLRTCSRLDGRGG